jgi:hypothetical protein
MVLGAAFALVWLIHWSKKAPNNTVRYSLLLVEFTIVGCLLYIYMRRQWLQYLRQRAVETASALVTNLNAFEASSASAIAFVQEVELVSRGYRMYVCLSLAVTNQTNIPQ